MNQGNFIPWTPDSHAKEQGRSTFALRWKDGSDLSVRGKKANYRAAGIQIDPAFKKRKVCLYISVPGKVLAIGTRF